MIIVKSETFLLILISLPKLIKFSKILSIDLVKINFAYSLKYMDCLANWIKSLDLIIKL